MKSPKRPTAKTDTTPYKGHTPLYVTGLVVALLTLGVTALVAKNGTPGWEHSLSHSINDWSASLSGFMQFLTFFGSQWTAVIVVIAGFVLRYYRLAWRLALSIIGAYGTAFIAKHIVGRERPAELFSNIHARVQETGMGFPSGHATVSTVIALTLLPYLPWKWRFIVPIMILAVAISRVYLGVHLPLDVIGGIALGTAIVSFVRVLPQPLRVLLRID